MWAELKLHVDVPVVLEAVLKLDDVKMLHRLVNLDLSKELQTSSSASLFLPSKPRVDYVPCPCSWST